MRLRLRGALVGDCGVCIGGGDYDGYSEFESIAEPKARKQHICRECRRLILAGQRYRRFSGKFEGSMFCEKTCLDCVEILAAFNCDGGALEDGLWNDIEQYVFPKMTTGCLDRLSTPETKKYLRDRWLKWKGLDA